MFRNRILIIDDEPETVHILTFALERAGYEVVTVTSAQDALPIALQQEVELVLLDLVLTEGSGLEICRALRGSEATKTLPIILVTGKLRTEFDTVEGFKAGADDYVMKPFRPAEVVARVGTLLDRTRRLRDASPVTQLPGPLVIQAELRRLLQSPVAWGVLFADLNGFKVYNDVYGFPRGDDALRALAASLASVERDGEHRFLGHAGSDNFVLTVEPESMEATATNLIAAFDALLPSLYPPETIEAGCVKLRTRRGEEVSAPLLGLTLAGVTNELRSFRNPLEVSNVGSELQAVLRSESGSGYKKDRRTD